MTHYHPLTLALGIALATGCATKPQTPDWNAAELSGLRPAQHCEAWLPFFGHYMHVSERNAGTLFMPADGRITVRNDGGWCMIHHKFAWQGQVLTPQMTMTEPPQHGDVVLGATAGELRLAYRPVSGYSGLDAFVVRLHAPVPETIPVRVKVQP